MPRSLLLTGVRDAADALFVRDGRLADPEAVAGADDVLALDLRGDRVLPGLVNAHEHLHLNALPRLKFRERHRNVADWIADITPRLATDPTLLAHRRRPRAQRLWWGAIKNLLCGVTTVVHHDPLPPELDEPGFPVRVLRRGGWINALGLDGPEAVRRSHRATPPDQPWLVHAAEGIDAEARAEFDVLDRLGCITSNTVLVHGVGLTDAQRVTLLARGGGLVWCPGSNLHLFGETAALEPLLSAGRVALGSDSRASGSADLLEELALAQSSSGLDAASLEAMVTRRPADMLGLADRGRLAPGALADLVVLPRGLALPQARRGDLRLVLLGGEVLLADPELAETLGLGADLRPVRVDGRPRFLARRVVERLRALDVREPGLALDAADEDVPA